MSDQYLAIHMTPPEGIVLEGNTAIAGGLPYAKNYGAILQSQLNRIKHTVESFAALYGLDAAYLREVTLGRAPLTAAVVRAVATHAPLTVRELIEPRYQGSVPLADDTQTSGVIVCHAADTEQSRRTIQRGPESQKVDYYDYLDTAVQRRSPIIPEYIVERFSHDGTSADVPDWTFNNGHRERQITIAIGRVNYHWIDHHGNKRVILTSHGDANFITPFTRHSFTRQPGQYGAILAATDLGAIGTEAFQQKIQALNLEMFFSMLNEGMLRLPVPLATDALGGFIFRRYADTFVSSDPAFGAGVYETKILMDNIPCHAHFRAVEYLIKQCDDPEDLDITSDAYRWGFNWGSERVRLYWAGDSAEVEPGGSFSIQRRVPHALRNVAGGNGRLIVMESHPEAEEPFGQLALIARYSGHESLARVHSETHQWF